MHKTLDHPVRMLFIKFALSIDHFRLYPETELYAMTVCGTDKSLNPVRKLGLVHTPVSQTLSVVVSRVLVSEPAVIHDEEFTTH